MTIASESVGDIESEQTGAREETAVVTEKSLCRSPSLHEITNLHNECPIIWLQFPRPVEPLRSRSRDEK